MHILWYNLESEEFINLPGLQSKIVLTSRLNFFLYNLLNLWSNIFFYLLQISNIWHIKTLKVNFFFEY